ncbi:MAG: D-glycerate dehydrogenase [Pseudomonadota bacterium]|nr:D-glycerate dehydrogenase [Pseudomonadota bacterium]
MKVVVTFSIPDAARQMITKHAFLQCWESEDSIPRATLIDWCTDADAILTTLTCPIGSEVLVHAPQLKIISTVSVGVDHIDVGLAAERGVIIGHTPGVLTDSTADLTLALMLGVGRRVAEGDALIRSGAWSEGWKPNLLLGTDLSGATVGLIGLGPIGQAVAARLNGFGCRVIASNRTMRSVEGLEFVDRDTLLSTAEIVSLHTALTPETAGMIGRRELALMQDGAMLINTARGALVDEAALIAEVKSGRLRAGLDVYVEEPLPLGNELADLPGCVLLPHVGSATERTRRAMFELALANLFAGLQGHKLPARLSAA